MREIVRRIDSPFVSGAVVSLVQHTISREIPHLWIAIGHVLFHAEKCFLRSVLSISHGPKLGQRFFDGSVTVGAGVAREPFTFAPLLFDFCICWMGSVRAVMDLLVCVCRRVASYLNSDRRMHHHA